ncbi:syntenin-1 [Halictus rubicundus]|uniref:syntenin-1 n=1 Tax=Halictus rubicundus TaxID=77578 RepID=UPI00403620FB
MSLYPTLEDMKVDQMMKVQQQVESHYNAPSLPQIQNVPSAPPYSSTMVLYPSLGEYMGLELTQEVIEQNMPEYSLAASRANMTVSVPATSGPLAGMVAPLSGQSVGLQRANVTHGIRELILCKDKDGKIGLRVHAVDNGIFVCLVSQNSPAALAGLRFGDQILTINDVAVAGYTMERVHKMLRGADVNGIRVVIRDRPFERTVTMHKDSSGNIGFQFKNGRIIALVENSSAARNGLLTDQQILEVNGKNVVGLKDKEITAEIKNAENVITITIIPSYIYDHMIKKMNSSLLKTFMDHSIPDDQVQLSKFF